MPGEVFTNQVGTKLYWRHNPSPFPLIEIGGMDLSKISRGQFPTNPICSVVSERKKSKDARMSSFFSLEFNSTISRSFWHRHWKKKVFKKKILWDFYFIKVNAQGQSMTYELRIGWVLLWTGWDKVLLKKSCDRLILWNKTWDSGWFGHFI